LGAIGLVNVTVRNPDAQQAILANGFRFDPLPPPVFSAVNPIHPNSDRISGGTVITIDGTGLRPGIAVNLGAHACGAVAVNPAGTSLTCTTPAVGVGSIGLVNVTVRNPDAQQAVQGNGFTFADLCGAADERNNRLQEAIWLCSEATFPSDTARADQLRINLRTIMESNNFNTAIFGGGGVNWKQYYRYNDGNFPPNNLFRGLFKPGIVGSEAEAYAEVAAYELDVLLDLRIVPMTVIKNFLVQQNIPVGVALAGMAYNVASIQYFVEPALNACPLLGAAVRPQWNPNNRQPGNLPNNPDLETVQVLDYIIGNPDRYNGANLMQRTDVLGQIKLFAIDNGGGFQEKFGGSIDSVGQLLYVAGDTLPYMVNAFGPDPLTTADLSTVIDPAGTGVFLRIDQGIRVNLNNLNPRVQNRIIHANDAAIRNRLLAVGVGLNPLYVERVIFRLRHIRNLLQGLPVF
ncbi:MAG: IPT/TIG domain-containing protein, partial [Oligoflexia bacterium]|nr:IPT/TIG domain-containing protein [Oligoflexia bacterium]